MLSVVLDSFEGPRGKGDIMLSMMFHSPAFHGKNRNRGIRRGGRGVVHSVVLALALQRRDWCKRAQRDHGSVFQVMQLFISPPHATYGKSHFLRRVLAVRQSAVHLSTPYRM